MLCLIAKLDDASTERLEALRDGLKATKKPLYGHITVSAYCGDDEEAFAGSCRKYTNGILPFSVKYSGLEVLSATSIIVAAPDADDRLSLLNEKLSAEFGDMLNVWTRRENWQPHTTLIHSENSDLEKICCEMKKSFEPFYAHIKRFELSRVNGDSYEIIERLML